MTDLVTSILLWFSAIGCGMMAGIYFVFSAFAMAAFGRIPQEGGIAAMQAINRVILRSAFMPLFWGTTLSALALAGLALAGWDRVGAGAMLAGGLLYVGGMFGVTLIFNVPLNNRLDAVNPGSPEAAPVWARYLKVWTAWNHLRTVASAAAAAAFIAALVAG